MSASPQQRSAEHKNINIWYGHVIKTGCKLTDKWQQWHFHRTHDGYENDGMKSINQSHDEDIIEWTGNCIVTSN